MRFERVALRHPRLPNLGEDRAPLGGQFGPLLLVVRAHARRRPLKDRIDVVVGELLDQIIELYVEQDASRQEMVAAGFSPEDVERVVRLVDLNEYKRRQAPVGVRISRRAFGRDRRYPITWAWRSSS